MSRIIKENPVSGLVLNSNGQLEVSVPFVLQSSFNFNSPLYPTQITADQNNYNPSGLDSANIVFLNSNGSRNITGLVAPTISGGRFIMIINNGTNNITLIDNSASSTASNRFNFNGNTLLNPNEGVIIVYDVLNSRWRSTGKAI
jgi:hypothetical protein